MEFGRLTMFLVFLISFLVQGLMAISIQETELEKQLLLINKPAVKSFKTKYGDILDCVEIHKQLAFDHPLLKNHSIQMKPTRSLSIKSSKGLKVPQFLPSNVTCPKGTVLVKRVQMEDLLKTKTLKLFGTQEANQVPKGYEAAYVLMQGKNTGVHGNINLWQPDVAADQLSSGTISVESYDGSNLNNIAAGWSVNPELYQSSTRLYILWTRDSGKSTGCYNLQCPGFVQVSREITPGVVLQPLSTYGGKQFDIILRIKQDTKTGNWWVNLQDKDVGCYPKDLFTTLGGGGDEVGWGGEVGSPTSQPFPAMGSGHFPEDGVQKACYVDQMTMFDTSGAEVYPDIKTLRKIETKASCYRTLYAGDGGGQAGHYMFFGGPPDCKF